MVRCSKCRKQIASKTRHVIGDRGGRYHVACASHIKNKGFGWTR